MRKVLFIVLLLGHSFLVHGAIVSIASVEAQPGDMVSLSVYIENIDFVLAGGELVIIINDTLEFRNIKFEDGILNNFMLEQGYQDNRIAVTFARAQGVAILRRSLLFNIEVKVKEIADASSNIIIRWKEARLFSEDRTEYVPSIVDGYIILSKRNDLNVGPKVITVQETPDGYNDYTKFEFPNDWQGSKEIEIFDLNGRKVWQANLRSESFILWYGKNQDNQRLEPGAYIYIVKYFGAVIGKGVITVVS